eukprot:COSAG06_NODE_64672_length_259_cov_0.518750_1_plen_65_part_01
MLFSVGVASLRRGGGGGGGWGGGGGGREVLARRRAQEGGAGVSGKGWCTGAEGVGQERERNDDQC